MKSEKAVLIIDSTENNPDLLYATGGFSVPDPVIFLSHGVKSFLVLSDLEIARGRKEAAVSEVLPLSAYMAKLRRRKNFLLADVAGAVLREKNIRSVEVPGVFPAAFADALRKKGMSVSCSKEKMLFRQRMKKTPLEVSLIRKSLTDTACAMRTATGLISNAKPGKNGALFLRGKPLTSEIIKRAINSELAGKGYSVSGTIVASGSYSAMPHHSGEGAVFAGQPVVIDIFPKSQSGYFGDMTRTVIKGKPSAVLARIYKTVLAAQKMAIGIIKHGVKASDVHEAVINFFNSQGFQTRRGDNPQGFIHSTGHGLGMGLHEPPGIGPSGDVLEEGNVVTVEPGLYYDDIGGVRIEDVVVVKRRGAENLTKCTKRFSV